jgi:hypothetical protein
VNNCPLTSRFGRNLNGLFKFVTRRDCLVAQSSYSWVRCQKVRFADSPTPGGARVNMIRSQVRHVRTVLVQDPKEALRRLEIAPLSGREHSVYPGPACDLRQIVPRADSRCSNPDRSPPGDVAVSVVTDAVERAAVGAEFDRVKTMSGWLLRGANFSTLEFTGRRRLFSRLRGASSTRGQQ